MLNYKENNNDDWINPLDSQIGCHSLNDDEKIELKRGLDFVKTFSFQLKERLKKNLNLDICYNHELDQLQIPIPERFKSIEKYLLSLFHEYGHATGHNKRLNRTSLLHAYGYRSDLNRLEEVTAEMVSIRLAKQLNLNADYNNCYEYIMTFIHTYEPEKADEILDMAQYQADEAIKYLLNK